MKKNIFIKANRIFTPIRKYAWILTLCIAIGGLWYPKLGLLVFGIILGLITTSFFKGRYWCGNFCPHGSLFDHILLKFSPNKKFPPIFQSTALKVFAFGFFSFSMGRKLIEASAHYGQYNFWDKLGFVFVTTYFMVLIAGILFSITINSRTWCNFCPMGTLQVLSNKLGSFLKVNRKTQQRITMTSPEACYSCGKCAKVCPMQLAPYKEPDNNNQFDNVCIQCSTCVEHCPAKILAIEKANKKAA